MTSPDDAPSEELGLIHDPKAHAITLADMIQKAADGFEAGSVRAHREQWAIVIAALRAFAAPPPTANAPVNDSGAQPEMWRDAMEQKPQPCACRFEWRPTPDFSGALPKQLDECGFHAEQRRKLLSETVASATVPEEVEIVRTIDAALRPGWCKELAEQIAAKAKSEAKC